MDPQQIQCVPSRKSPSRDVGEPNYVILLFDKSGPRLGERTILRREHRKQGHSSRPFDIGLPRSIHPFKNRRIGRGRCALYRSFSAPRSKRYHKSLLRKHVAKIFLNLTFAECIFVYLLERDRKIMSRLKKQIQSFQVFI